MLSEEVSGSGLERANDPALRTPPPSVDIPGMRILWAVLRALELKDFAIVDELQVEFSPGLNVLTGETGAGKSILIDALAFLIGGRADSGFVRSGCDSALIQGLFSKNTLGVESAARRLQASGRSSARLNGELITVGELAGTGGQLVAIHGQHAFQTLMDAGEQRRLLDRLLGDEAKKMLVAYGELFREYGTLTRELESLRDATRERARRLDIRQYQLDEIDGAKLKPGEEEKVAEEAEGLRHAERIVQGAGRAVNLLSEADTNAVDLIADAQRHLEGAGRYQKTLEALAGELSDALASVQAIGAEVSSFLSDFEVEPGRLEKLQSRLAQIEGLKLKYGDSVEAVLAYRNTVDAELQTLMNAETNMTVLEARRSALEAELKTRADALTRARTEAGAFLAREVTAQLHPLGMEKAQFTVSLEPQAQFTGHGQDKVTFLFSANVGEPPAPLSAVASGGELSRVMLALNVVTGSDLPTLAFDEVDAGIGGQTGRAIGLLLKRLAQDHQVLVVTHLPQVAAFADAQFHVRKLEKDGRTVTRVSRLEPHEREAELARMLSGAVTDTALAHARELLRETQGV
jgi:DNA repair protein RecN (Recombination protein N)